MKRKLYGSTPDIAPDDRLIKQILQSLPSFFSYRQPHRNQSWRC